MKIHWWMDDFFGEWSDEIIHYLSTTVNDGKDIGPYHVSCYPYPPINRVTHSGHLVWVDGEDIQQYRKYNHSKEWMTVDITVSSVLKVTTTSTRTFPYRRTIGPLPCNLTLTEMGVIIDAKWKTHDRIIPLEEMDEIFDTIPLLDDDETKMLWKLMVE